MATETFYRKANVSRAEATAALFAKFPNAQLDSFVKKAANAEEATAAKANVGDPIYAATVTAEFPPPASGGEEGGSDSAPEAPSSEEGGSDDSGDEGSSDSAPDFTKDDDSSESGDEDGEKKEKKLPPAEETVNLLREIKDLLAGGGAPGGPGGDPSLDAGAAGLPDIGAPAPGEELPPPAGGPGAGAPLPPPVPQKAPMGGNAFAHYDPAQAEIHSVRVEAGEVRNTDLIKQAEEVYPTHTVAKIQRTGKAQLNGKTYDLAKNGVALITLVKK